MSSKKNVLGGPLEACCYEPKTGYFRDGYCRTDETDRGRHVVCALRWREAWEENAAPPVILEACEETALQFIPLEVLEEYAIQSVH